MRLFTSLEATLKKQGLAYVLTDKHIAEVSERLISSTETPGICESLDQILVHLFSAV